MKNNQILKLILLHTLFFLLATTLFIIFFHTSLFINSVFFYRGITLLGITTLILIICIYKFRKHQKANFFTSRDLILSTVIFFCINLVFFTHLPVTADRSISVFMLAYMNNHSNPLTKTEMTNIFINKYLTNNDAIQKRFDEQITSGNIQKTPNNYQITAQGKFIISFYKFISDLFVIDKKNISQ